MHHQTKVVGIAVSGDGELTDVRHASSDVIGNPQRRDYPEAPGSTEIAQHIEIERLLGNGGHLSARRQRQALRSVLNHHHQAVGSTIAARLGWALMAGRRSVRG
jgi:hypothetical protein